MPPEISVVNSSPITAPQQPTVSETTPQEQVRPSVVQGQMIPRSPQEVRNVGVQQLNEPPNLGVLEANDDIMGAQDIMANMVNGPDETDRPKANSLTLFFQAAGRIIKSIFSGKNSEPRFHELPAKTVLHHPSGREISISSKALPPIPLGTNLEDFTAGIQNKINRGGDLVTTILNGDIGDRQCSKKDMTDIMWFLHTGAESKVGEAWSQGAVSIEDPQGRLRDFLDSSSETYQRASTHIKELQSFEGCRPRGFDVYGDAQNIDELLPYGKQTLMYNAIPSGTNGKVQGPPSQMLLLKMEEHGCWKSNPKDGVENPGPNRLGNAHDGEAFRGHIKTTIKSLFRSITGSNTAPGTHKERVSDSLGKGYNSLIKSIPKSLSVGGQNLRELLSQNKPTSSSGGIRIMNQNIKSAIAALSQANDLGVEDALNALEAFKSSHLHGKGEQDHMALRFGNEVIFTQTELKTDFNNAMKTTVGELAKSITQDVDHGVLVDNLKQELIGGAKSTSEGLKITEQGVSKQFILDFVDRSSKLNIGGKSIAWEPDPNITGMNGRGTCRIAAMKDFFGENTKAMALMSQITNQMSDGCISSILQAPGRGGPFDMARGNILCQVNPINDSHAVINNYSIFKDDDGNFHLRVNSNAKLQMVQSPESAEIELDRENSSLSYSFEAVIPSDTTGEADDIQILSMNYQLKTSE